MRARGRQGRPTDAYLANEIVDIYRAPRCTYGSPRVWGQVRCRGVRVSKKRVARIMAELGLVGAHSRLSRNFSAEASALRRAADITEFK